MVGLDDLGGVFQPSQFYDSTHLLSYPSTAVTAYASTAQGNR